VFIVPIKIVVEPSDISVESHRSTVSERVIESFGIGLPHLRLIIFLDKSDCPFLHSERGNRGAHFRINKTTMQASWPELLEEHILGKDVKNGLADYTGNFHYDNLIYVHGSTCTDDVGLTMTLAHELQHFIQYGIHRNIWVLNTLVGQLSTDTFKALRFTWADIPIEREARITQKRIAIKLWGVDKTNQYIERKRLQRITDEDAADWAFVQSIDPEVDFNVCAATPLLFQRVRHYRSELETRLRELVDDPDFDEIDLETLCQ
jgi:hypothetical protein